MTIKRNVHWARLSSQVIRSNPPRRTVLSLCPLRSKGRTALFSHLLYTIYIITISSPAFLARCKVTDPNYCNTDQDCQDSTHEGYDPNKPKCYIDKHYCYTGCQSDQDCQDITQAWYMPEHPKCNVLLHECVATEDGGLPDQSMLLDGSIDSDALIKLPDASKERADSYKSPVIDSQPTNDRNPAQFDTLAADTAPLKLALGTKCSKGEQCQSGKCVDSVCCQSECKEKCKACNLPGKEGSCGFVLESAGPINDCPGESCCGGNGKCDGQGGCLYSNIGKECNKFCDVGKLNIYTCDSFHQCNNVTTISCGLYRCDSYNKRCLTSCAGNGDCVFSSNCYQGDCHPPSL